jgi:hypothetical protein
MLVKALEEDDETLGFLEACITPRSPVFCFRLERRSMPAVIIILDSSLAMKFSFLYSSLPFPSIDIDLLLLQIY